MKYKLHHFILIFLVVSFADPAKATESRWYSADHAQAKLISKVDTIGEQDHFDALVHIRLAPGWHTYWRNSGDTGLPPSFDWQASKNIERIDVSFSTPKRFQELDLITFGYDRDVMLPLDIKLEEANKDTHLDMQLQILICKDICIPQRFEMFLEIPAGDGELSRSAAMVEFAKARTPKEDSKSLKIDNVVFGQDKFVMDVYSNFGFDRFDVFVELGDYSLTDTPKIKLKDDKREAQITIDAPKDVGNLADYSLGKKAIITVTNGRDSIEGEYSF